MLAVFALLSLLILGCGDKAPTSKDTGKGGDAKSSAKDTHAAVGSTASTAAKTTEAGTTAAAGPLKIGYSDWPGWLVWEIAKQKGLFKEAGVEVDLVWFGDYGKSIDAYSANKLDAILIACGDSLTAKASVIVVLTDYSNGNDMIIGKKGVDSIKALKGKTVGLELNLVEHLLLVAALEKNTLKEEDVTIKKMDTPATPEALKTGDVDAVGAWYPISGKALEAVAGSKPLFTSADAPGLIYDALQVDPDSLKSRRNEWKKVVGVWFKCLKFLDDPKTHKEAIEIMAKRIDAKPEDLEKNLKGTALLNEEGNQKAMRKRRTLESIYGSLQNADDFYVKRKVYEKHLDVTPFVDPSLLEEVLGK